MQLTNSNIKFDINDNLLRITSFKGNIDKGKYNIDGNFILDSLPTLNLAYSFSNFQLSNYLSSLLNINNISAFASISGSLKTFGNTPKIMMTNLTAQNKYFLKQIYWNELAIPKIVQEIANLSSKPKKSFLTPVDQMITKGRTGFNNSEGTLNIIDGVAYINNIKLHTKNYKSTSIGKVDLINNLIKINSAFVFTAFYRVKQNIKKKALSFTQSVSGDFNSREVKNNMFQVKNFVDNLKLVSKDKSIQIRDYQLQAIYQSIKDLDMEIDNEFLSHHADSVS